MATDASQLTGTLLSGSISLVSLLVVVYIFLIDKIESMRETRDPSAYVTLSKILICVMISGYLCSVLCILVLLNGIGIFLTLRNPSFDLTILSVACFLYNMSAIVIIYSIYYISCREIW